MILQSPGTWMAEIGIVLAPDRLPFPGPGSELGFTCTSMRVISGKVSQLGVLVLALRRREGTGGRSSTCAKLPGPVRAGKGVTTEIKPHPHLPGTPPTPTGRWKGWIPFLEGPETFFMVCGTRAECCRCPWLSPAIAESCKSSLFYFMNCKNYHTFHRYLRTR